jgi:CrcB protein
MSTALGGGYGPIDPDLGPEPPPGAAPAPSGARGLLPVLAVIAAGGGLGAAARYGTGLLWPSEAGTFPWTLLAVNAAGCAVIGVFMVIITERRRSHRLARPFFGVGVLGGFTTFSAYAGDVHRLLDDGRTGTGLAYLAATPLLAVAAVAAAAALTRRVLAPGPA